MSTGTVPRGQSMHGPQRAGFAVLIYAITTVMAVVFTIPFLWAISTSLKQPNMIYLDPPQWIPRPAVFRNYIDAMKVAPFALYFRNTLVVTLLAGFGRVFVSTIVAYGFARFRFPGRDVLFSMLLAIMMIPTQVLLVPQYLLFNSLGWVNSFKPLIVPAYLGVTAFMIFLARQFLLTLPRELDEAAEIDGCGPLATFARILLPLCKPFLATAVILSFQGDWNAFLGPLVYLQSEDRYTLALGLRYLQSMSGGVEMAGRPMDHLIMAASITVLAPIIVIFLLFQRYFVRGITMTGLKG
jgi:multiple sugar transport system permease protein